MAAGSAVSAIGALRSGQTQAANLRFQQALALQQANREREIAKLDADERRRKGAALEGKQRALLAGAGVVPGTGTALLLHTDLAA